MVDTVILPTAHTECMHICLDAVSVRHPEDRMVMDGAGWHRSHMLTPPKHVDLLSVPPSAPELNPVENLWDDVREQSVGNLGFDSLRAREAPLEVSRKNFEMEHERVKSIVSWPWIINSLIN